MRYALVFLLFTIGTGQLEAQRNCKKGIPCGNSCISASKVCRIGSREPAPEPMPAYVAPSNEPEAKYAAPAASPAPLNAPIWLGQPHGRVYYLASCQAAKELPEPIYFSSEAQAQQMGYKRSRVPGC